MPELELEDILVEPQTLDQFLYEKHPVNEEDKAYLESALGSDYLDAIAKSGATLYSIKLRETNSTPKLIPFRAFYYKFADTTITLKVTGGDNKTVTLDFLKTSDFQQGYGNDDNDDIPRDMPDSKNYFHVDGDLSQNTLSLLNHLERTSATINNDCTLILRPNTKRRERIYTRLANRHPEKSNFVIEPVGIDDRKNINFWL